MVRFRWRKADKSEVEERIASEEEAALAIREAKEREAALTPEIREDAQWLNKRGKVNRYGESLMLAWELKQGYGHGHG